MYPHTVFLTAIFPSMPAFAADPSLTIWPPDGCSAKQPGVVTWQDGTKTGTRCMSAQDILKLALPKCKAGQLIVFDGSSFSCKEPPRTSAEVER